MAGEDARRAMMLTVVTSVATSYVQLLALDHQLEPRNRRRRTAATR